MPSLQNLNSFTGSDDDNEDDDDEDDDMDASFDNSDNASNKFAQYPRPKIVPVDYNKKKQVCVCEQCGGSWSRKEYYYHHKVSEELKTSHKALLRLFKMHSRLS